MDKITKLTNPLAYTVKWAKDALAASLKPDADYRRRRLAHLSSERVQRYWENVEGLRG